MAALAAGNFNGDGFDDLAIGAPFESLPVGIVQAGAVHIINGSSVKLSATGNQFWHQDVGGIIEVNENFDHFGQSLAAGDFNGNGRADLAISAPWQDVAGTVDAGVIFVLMSNSNGLSIAGDRLWHQNVVGILDASESDDFFGDTMTP
jgi:hypothetical protein